MKSVVISVLTLIAAADGVQASSESMAAFIQDAGLNCPKVVSVKPLDEDAYGLNLAVTCSALSGTPWMIRAQIAPNGESRFAPWDEYPPQWKVRPAPAKFELKRRGQ